MKLIDVDQLEKAVLESTTLYYDKHRLLEVLDKLPTFSEDDISVSRGAWVEQSGIHAVCSGVVKLCNGNPDWKDVKVCCVYEGEFDNRDNSWCVGKRITKYIFNPKRNEIYIDPSQDCETVIVFYKVFNTNAKVIEVKCDGSR